MGIDAGKKTKGTKRHVATDVLGLLLVVLVTAASVQDTVGGRAVVAQVAQHHPQVVVAWADSGYKQSVIDSGATRAGATGAVVCAVATVTPPTAVG
jgi:hypothetical protein